MSHPRLRCLYLHALPRRAEPAAVGFSGFKIEPYGMQRIEVLKGPASVLYGENDVGGLVNAITKRPPSEPMYDGYASYGSFETFEAGIDVGGPIDEAGVWSYRLTGLLPRRLDAAGLHAERPHLHRAGTDLATRRTDIADHSRQLPMGQARPDLFRAGARHDRLYRTRSASKLLHRTAWLRPVRRQPWLDRLSVQPRVRRALDRAPEPSLCKQDTDYRQLYYGERRRRPGRAAGRPHDRPHRIHRR